MGFEPPEMSWCGSYDDTESLFLEHNTYNMQMGQETCSLESVSTNDDRLEAPYIVQQTPQLQPEPKRYSVAEFVRESELCVMVSQCPVNCRGSTLGLLF